jgi:hypothetical protein
MIRVTCPKCGSRLNAKEKLAGQTRACPQCGGPVVIPQPSETAEPLTEIVQTSVAETLLRTEPLLKRLNRTNRYLICDSTSVAATWRNDGRGWMIRIASGFAPAKRNREALAPAGEFTLVELQMEMTDAGLRLAAIESYDLASRFAMTKLDKGDDDILEVVTGHGTLSRAQKNAVRHILGELFMREVWGDSPEVLDYLANADYHSHGSRAEKE